jgi:hypothetical protein
MKLLQDQLDELDIRDWQECTNFFSEADILLGNGFSMNLSPKFSYVSLFDKFLNKCTHDQQILFRSFSTTNFEVIQHHLLITQRVIIISELIQPSLIHLLPSFAMA